MEEFPVSADIPVCIPAGFTIELAMEEQFIIAFCFAVDGDTKNGFVLQNHIRGFVAD